MGNPMGNRLRELLTLHLLLDVRARLIRIEAKMDHDNTELGQELDQIEADEATEAAAIDHVLADLEAKEAAGTLTGDEHQRLEAIRAEIRRQTDEVNAADPAPATVPDPGSVVTEPANPTETVPSAGDGSAAAGDQPTTNTEADPAAGETSSGE